MRKIFTIIAAVLCAMSMSAASITAADVDFGSVSIKGQSSVMNTIDVPVSWKGLSDQGYSMYAEISENNDNFYVSGEAYYYMGYGSAMTYSTTFTIGYYAETAGTFTGKLHLYSFDTNYNQVDKYVNLKVIVTNEAIVAKTVPFERIESTSGLKAGDTIVFVNEAAGAVSGALNNTYLTAITEGVKIEAGKADVPEEAQTFVLGQYGGNWQFTATGTTNKLCLDITGKGAFTYAPPVANQILAGWGISIDKGVAYVSKPDETFPVRFNTDRFKPYKSGESAGTDICLYRKAGKAEEIKSKLEINPATIVFEDCEMDEKQTVEIAYTAENLTDDIVWAIEGTDAALFDVANEGDRKSGTISISYKGNGAKAGAVNAKLTYLTQNASLDLMEGEFPISLNLLATTIKLTKIEFVGAPETIEKGGTLDLGKYVVLTPNNAADKSLIWTTDHDYQGTVDANGVVTAKHVGGTITVTATSVRVPSVSASHTLTIVVPAAESIQLSETEMTIHVGDKQTLTASVIPSGANQDVTFESSNSDVAAVSYKGVITAKALGDAIITVKAKSNADIKATCTVHVVAVTVESIAFSSAETNLSVGSSLQLEPIVTPAQAAGEYPISYSSDNEAVASVSETGLVTAKAEGTAIITAIIDGKQASITIHVVGQQFFSKVTDAASLKANDTIILAAEVTLTGGPTAIAAGAVNNSNGSLDIIQEGVTLTESSAAADGAMVLIIGGSTDNYTLTVAGESKQLSMPSDKKLGYSTSKNNKWKFEADANGVYLTNVTYSKSICYNGQSGLIRMYAASVSSMPLYVFVRPFIKDNPQGVEDVQSDKVQTTKVLRNGQLYLMYKGQMYDVRGTRVQ